MSGSAQDRLIYGTKVFLDNPKFPHNIGAAIRAVACYEGDSVVWTGDRWRERLPEGKKPGRLPREERMRGYAEVHQMNMRGVADAREWFPKIRMGGKRSLVCVELVPGAEPLTTFVHPERAIYLFGPEDGSLNAGYRSLCDRFVFIPSGHCLNLAVAIGTVLYDRRAKRQMAGLEPILPVDQQLAIEQDDESVLIDPHA